MEITYASNQVRKCFEDYSKMQRILSLNWTRAIKKHITNLTYADNFGVILDLGIGQPEYLQGYKDVVYSLRVDSNVRLILKLDATPGTVRKCVKLEVMGVCDYHGSKENWYIS